MLFWPTLIIVLAVLGLMLWNGAPVAQIEGGEPDLRIVYLSVVAAGLLIAGVSRLILRRGKRRTIDSAVWIGTIAGLATAYVFRDDAANVIEDLREEAAHIIEEIRLEMKPSIAVTRVMGEEELRRDWRDGHYSALAEVNGMPLQLMVDTGASMVLIRHEDAMAIGIDPDMLTFGTPVTTANGRSMVAPVRLSSIRIGTVAVFDVPAAVAQKGKLKTGLLGMSFIERLAEASFRGDRLILRQRAATETPDSYTVPTEEAGGN